MRGPGSAASSTRHSPELGIVAAAVRVGVTDLTPQAMMTEQRAESRRSHGLAAVAAFQRDEQSGRVDQGLSRRK